MPGLCIITKMIVNCKTLFAKRIIDIMNLSVYKRIGGGNQ